MARSINTGSNMHDLYSRQTSIVDMQKVKQAKVCIIGSGAIGSMTAIILAKLGVNYFTIWDDDKVEIHNLPNQYYKNSDLGKFKVEALAKVIKEYNPEAIVKEYNKKFNSKKDSISDDILIVAVDDMDVRAKIWAYAKTKPAIKRVIEARMGGESFRVYSLSPEMIIEAAAYEKTLYSSKKAEPIRCTEKAIIYNIAVLCGLIAGLVKDFLMKTDPTGCEILGDLNNMYFVKNRLSVK